MVFSKYLVELGQKMFFLRNLYDLKKIQLKDILDTYTKYLKEQGESNMIKMYLKLVYKDVNDSEKPHVSAISEDNNSYFISSNMELMFNSLPFSLKLYS